MLLPIKPICSAAKSRRDGTSLIFIQYCFSSENKTLLNTEIAVPSCYWHKKLNRITDDLPSQYGRANELNKELQRQIRLAEDIISVALENKVKDPVAFARDRFKPNFDINNLRSGAIEDLTKNHKLDFNEQFQQYIESKRKKVANATINVFHETWRYLQAFEVYRNEKL